MIYDVIIVGAGPGGLSASIYLKRAGRDVLVLEGGVAGGQMFLSHMVENYPGFIEAISGQKLSYNMEEQAKRLGVEFKSVMIDKITKDNNIFNVEGFGQNFQAKKVIVATGSKATELNVKGEKEFFGKGVSYCSTCDGMFFKNKDVTVVGGGNSAIEAAEHLSRICKTVTLVHRRDGFRADKILIDRIKNISNISILTNYVVEEILGTNMLEYLMIKNVKTLTTEKHYTNAVFIYTGSRPNNEILKDITKLDDRGYVLVDNNMMSSFDGLYVVGDLVSKNFRQIITAASDGAIAALSIDRVLA